MSSQQNLTRDPETSSLVIGEQRLREIQGEREAGHVSSDDALARLMTATNVSMALLLSGQDVRKAAPIVGGVRREER